MNNIDANLVIINLLCPKQPNLQVHTAVRPWDLNRWQNFDQEVKDYQNDIQNGNAYISISIHCGVGLAAWRPSKQKTWIGSSSRGDDRECLLRSFKTHANISGLAHEYGRRNRPYIDESIRYNNIENRRILEGS